MVAEPAAEPSEDGDGSASVTSGPVTGGRGVQVLVRQADSAPGSTSSSAGDRQGRCEVPREQLPAEDEHDNPLDTTEELASSPSRGTRHNREVTEADQVTLIRFSHILSTPKADAFGRQSRRTRLRRRTSGLRRTRTTLGSRERRSASLAHRTANPSSEPRVAPGAAKPQLPRARRTDRSYLPFRFVEEPSLHARSRGKNATQLPGSARPPPGAEVGPTLPITTTHPSVGVKTTTPKENEQNRHMAICARSRASQLDKETKEAVSTARTSRHLP